MEIDAELGVLEPLRCEMGFQGIPGGEVGQGIHKIGSLSMWDGLILTWSPDINILS